MKTQKKLAIFAILLVSIAALTACGAPRGGNFCDSYPEPEAEAFVADPGSIVEVKANDHIRGSDDALITMIVYSDFNCLDCMDLSGSLTSLVDDHDDTRYIYRHYLNEEGGISLMAALAAETAAALGGEEAFWEMHDELKVNRTRWMDNDEATFADYLTGLAGEIGLDEAAFRADLDSQTYKGVIESQMSDARIAGIGEAPVMAVNAFPITAPPTQVASLNMLREAFLPGVIYHEAPPMVIDPAKNYQAWIETSKGTIVVELFPDLAPQMVNNFAYLACNGYYDNIIWHRVIEGFVAQTGDPSGTGIGGPGYTVPDEYQTAAYLEAGLEFNREGLLSMAKSNAPDSARSQFFFTLAPASHLNDGFTIFGEIIEGLDVLNELTIFQARGLTPLAEGIQPDELISVDVREVEE